MISRIAFDKFQSHLEALRQERDLDCCIGAMLTRTGIFLLLFSHRHNQDFPMVVETAEASRVMQVVRQVLGPAARQS